MSLVLRFESMERTPCLRVCQVDQAVIAQWIALARERQGAQPQVSKQVFGSGPRGVCRTPNVRMHLNDDAKFSSSALNELSRTEQCGNLESLDVNEQPIRLSCL